MLHRDYREALEKRLTKLELEARDIELKLAQDDAERARVDVLAAADTWANSQASNTDPTPEESALLMALVHLNVANMHLKPLNQAVASATMDAGHADP